jgi:hypothetical protein
MNCKYFHFSALRFFAEQRMIFHGTGWSSAYIRLRKDMCNLYINIILRDQDRKMCIPSVLNFASISISARLSAYIYLCIEANNILHANNISHKRNLRRYDFSGNLFPNLSTLTFLKRFAKTDTSFQLSVFLLHTFTLRSLSVESITMRTFSLSFVVRVDK